MKKILSANPEATLAVECIMEDVDVRVGGWGGVAGPENSGVVGVGVGQRQRHARSLLEECEQRHRAVLRAGTPAKCTRRLHLVWCKQCLLSSHSSCHHWHAYLHTGRHDS
jgi:hypothetical protein